MVRLRLIGIAFLAAVALSCLAGCGGGSSSSTRADASRQFLGPNGKSEVAKFGHEASETELAEAARMVSKSLEARGAHNWAGQCSTLTKTAERDWLGEYGSGNACAAQLKEAAEKATPGVLKDNLRGAVVALRSDGRTGYALYHGYDGGDWSMPMEKEGSRWKVASLVAQRLPIASSKTTTPPPSQEAATSSK